MKKLIALLLALVMVFALAACSTTNEPAKENNNETSTDGKLYIPVMAKGFQHQFWQAVAKGSADAAKDYDVDIYFDGPASETEIDRRGKVANTFCKAYEKASLLTATEENVRCWTEGTRMTPEELQDTVKESREIAQVFAAIADIIEQKILPADWRCVDAGNEENGTQPDRNPA